MWREKESKRRGKARRRRERERKKEDKDRDDERRWAIDQFTTSCGRVNDSFFRDFSLYAKNNSLPFFYRWQRQVLSLSLAFSFSLSLSSDDLDEPNSFDLFSPLISFLSFKGVEQEEWDELPALIKDPSLALQYIMTWPRAEGSLSPLLMLLWGLIRIPGLLPCKEIL